VNKLVLVFPALGIPENWGSRYPRVEDIPDTTRLWNVPMGRRFFTELRDIKVFKQIGKFKKPVLIVQGDKDNIVPVESSKRAVKLYKDARLHIIPGAGHGFKSHELEESFVEIRKFLEETDKE
jgi:pimeloyl-ACP methyl ester carboxylesterase